MQSEEYRKMARVEDQMWYYRALHGHLVRVLRPRSKLAEVTLLDAGCGTGGLLRELQRAYPNWSFTGLDFSPLACELTRERTGSEVIQGSVLAMPFRDATFDVIVSCDVLCQVPDVVQALREFTRCLKPGGVLAMTMPAYQWMYSYHDEAVANLRRFTRGEINNLLGEIQAEVMSNTYWNMLPFPLAIARRKLFPPASPSSDVGLFPAPVEAMLNGLMALEAGWLWSGGRLPFGSSILTVARKSSHNDGCSTP